MMLADAARAMVGCQFRHQGRTPATGLDCVGLVIAAARMCGWELLDEKAYNRQPDPRILMDGVTRAAVIVEHGLLNRDNLLLIGPKGRFPVHAGIALGDGTMVHCDIKHGVHVTRVPIGSLHSAWRLKEDV